MKNLCSLIRVQFSAALLCVLAPSLAWSQTSFEFAKLSASDADEFDVFGTSVAIAGDRILTSATGEIDPNSGYPVGPELGAVYIHDRLTGNQIAKIEASDGELLDLFGRAVAADGNLGLVGAPTDALQIEMVGSVYVIDLQTGQEQRKLVAADGAQSDLFGFSIAIDGGLAIVGAPLDDDDGSASGAVYVFDANTGQRLFKLRPTDGDSYRRFGQGVAIDGGLAVVGAPGGAIYNGGTLVGFRRSAAYVFDVQTGQQLHKLESATAHLDEESFGMAVSLANGRAFVGAPVSSHVFQPPSPGGSVYSFDATTGQAINRMQPPIDSSYTNFGWALAADGNQVAVSASLYQLQTTGSGAAFVFDASSGQELLRLIASDTTTPGYLGSSIDLEAGTVAAGAMGESSAAEAAGAVYLFDTAPVNSGQGYCFGDGSGAVCPCGENGLLGEGCRNSGFRGAELFGAGDAVLGADSLVLSVVALPANTPGLFFQGTNQLSAPVGDGILCSNGSLRYSVQNSGPSGQVSRTGFGAAASSGSSINYQFWYRDTASSCGLGGFNFSNGWNVNW